MSSPDMALWITGIGLGLAVVAGLRGTWSPCGLSMVSAINPMSEHARGNGYAATCAWYVVGAVVGGAGLGVLSGLVAVAVSPLTSAVPAVALTIAAVAALVCLASDLQIGGRHLPVHARQVDERWLDTYRRWIYAGGYGLQIGSGFATYIMTAANYLLVVLMVLQGSFPGALLIGACFGLVRGLTVLLTAGARTPQPLLVLHRRLEALARPSLVVAMAAQGVAAALLAGAAGGWPAAGAAVVAAVAVTAVSAVAPTALAMRRPGVSAAV
jgi:hypothetical protein